jgi:Derlin-2/3
MPAPAATRLHDSGPQDWYRDIPIITKILVTATFSLTLFSDHRFGILPSYNLVLLWPQIYNNFQIWRLFTAVVYAGGFSFAYAMHLYMLYSFSLRYEANTINTGARGSAADYLWMLLIFSVTLWFLGYIFAMFVLSESLLFAIMYVWSRHEPNSMASIFGFQFRAIYMPWMYCAFRLLMGDPIVGILLGIATGIVLMFCISLCNPYLMYGTILFRTRLFFPGESAS